MIESSLFYTSTNIVYPPFKDGLYMEEYIVQRWKRSSESTPQSNRRKLIPAYWTNFQNASWFASKQAEMQRILDRWVQLHPSPNGYLVICQHADGPKLRLPPNTFVYTGSMSTALSAPLPLIYEDRKQRLVGAKKYDYPQKNILCSFVGCAATSKRVSPDIRALIQAMFSKKPGFQFDDSGSWTPSVATTAQQKFIDVTSRSKFAFAPRGYGRSSFRFYEILQLGAVPIYVYNDLIWLPYQNVLDYSKFAIVMHYKDLGLLEAKLRAVTETEYNQMLDSYKQVAHMFTFEGLYDYIQKETPFL